MVIGCCALAGGGHLAIDLPFLIWLLIQSSSVSNHWALPAHWFEQYLGGGWFLPYLNLGTNSFLQNGQVYLLNSPPPLAFLL
jgi:hypothetical protein